MRNADTSAPRLGASLDIAAGSRKLVRAAKRPRGSRRARYRRPAGARPGRRWVRPPVGFHHRALEVLIAVGGYHAWVPLMQRQATRIRHMVDRHYSPLVPRPLLPSEARRRYMPVSLPATTEFPMRDTLHESRRWRLASLLLAPLAADATDVPQLTDAQLIKSALAAAPAGTTPTPRSSPWIRRVACAPCVRATTASPACRTSPAHRDRSRCAWTRPRWISCMR